jgi:hypothetical protein
MELEERYWSKVDKGNTDECWEWQASTNRHGYGWFFVDGEPKLAHRVIADAKGMDTDGELVLHHCDNPSCVNPNHLYIGTQADNMRDRAERSDYSGQHGEEHGMAKLTEDEVKEIRERYNSENITQVELGEEYGIGQTQVSNIVRNANW